MADDDLLYAGADDALYVRDRADASAVGQRYPALLSEALKQRAVGTAAAHRGTDIQQHDLINLEAVEHVDDFDRIAQIGSPREPACLDYLTVLDQPNWTEQTEERR